MNNQKSVLYEDAVIEVRKACRQFAMLYFHFAKVLVEQMGEKEAKKIIQQVIFELAIDRSNQLRYKVLEKGLTLSMKNFQENSDLPRMGWDKTLGKNHCPYAETWHTYFSKNPWFREFAPFYCDVIDTTNAENFTRIVSHKITENVLKDGNACRRKYFESQKVKQGEFTYGKKNNK